MLRYLLFSIFALLLLTACGDSPADYAGGKEFAPPESSQDLSKVSENQTGKAQAQGLLIEEFSCFPSKIGYGANVRITNHGNTLHGNTLNNVSVKVYPLTSDKVKIASMISVGQDLPNGITGDFEDYGGNSNPSFIKFCDIRKGEALKIENMKEALKGGKYKELKFETVKGLEIPVPFKSIEITHQVGGRDVGSSIELDNLRFCFGCDLANADLRDADLANVGLSGVDLSWANLLSANLPGANLPNAELSMANLSGANLIQANLTGATLNLANLTNAILSETHLEGATLDHVVGADFRDALNVPAKYLKD